ncbi:MAG: HYExAFE family protein [Phycisphaeraceae bacterium]
MAQRRFHYDQAFERYLREKAIPYVAVDEAKRALQGAKAPSSLKSFDFVVYSEAGPNLLVDVKGRKHSGRSSRSLDNWVTRGDVESLRKWEGIFGQGFVGAFAFLYWCEQQPPDALFTEIFESGQRWYALLAVRLTDYQTHMRQRSPRWETVSIPAAQFNALARPLKELL